MIEEASYLSRPPESTSVLDFLESRQTDAEFRAMVSRNRFLHECKTKGFKKLEGLGLIQHGDKSSGS
jgi:hypothetical protein